MTEKEAAAKTLSTLDDIKEQIADLEFENRFMAKALKMLGFSQEEINTIAMCASLTPVEHHLIDNSLKETNGKRTAIKNAKKALVELLEHDRTVFTHEDINYHAYAMHSGYAVEVLHLTSESAGCATLEGGDIEQFMSSSDAINDVFGTSL